MVEKEKVENEVTSTQIADEKKLRSVKRKNRVQKGILITVIIILVMLLLFKGCSNGKISNVVEDVKNKFDVSVDENAREGGIDGKSRAEVQAELNSQVAASMINISMNASPVFENGDAEGNLNIYNVKMSDNAMNHLQVIQIYRDDTNELIYQSGVLQTGSSIKKAKLKVHLDAGTYDCTAHFNAVKEDGSYIGKACSKIKITVLN